MRGSVLGSSLVHGAILAVLLVVRTVAPVIVPGDVVQVALVDAPTMPMAAPAPPPPKPEVQAAEIAPTEEEGVKLEKKKKKKEPEPKEPDRREPEPPPAPRAALPYASVGNAGLRGQIALDAGDFEFTYYLLLVRNKVTQNWSPPSGLAGAAGTVRTVVYFKIGRGGEISEIALEGSSGAEFFDRSALRAVTISNPLPPLPLGYTGSRLGVHFGFEFSPP